MKKLLTIAIIALIILVFAVPALAAPAVYTNVGNYKELKAAVENATTTHIIFTSNIQLEKQTITVNPAKTELVIDGNGYTFTDAVSASVAHTIKMTKKGVLKNITFQNMNIVGYNYYGVLNILDSVSFSDVTVTFDKITYAGPGLADGRKSNFIIRNSDIKIIPSSVCQAHEVFECLRVRLEGDVNIVKEAPKSTTELFWITGANGGVTIATGAKVNVSSNKISGKTANSTGFVYYSCPSLHFIFEDDSYFDYFGNNLFQQGSSIDILRVGERAEVNITLSGDLYCTYGAFHVRGDMKVEKGSILNIFALNNKAIQPVLQLRGTGKLSFNSPQEVFIYNSSTKACNTALAMGPYGCDVTINFNNVKSIEYWRLNTAPPDNLPLATYWWSNLNGADFSASERISGSTVKTATTAGYYGITPFNTKTAAVKDINVVRINGGFPQNEAKVVVVCRDTETGVELAKEEHFVPRGAYGPYTPFYSSTDYEFVEWLNTSDPAQGIISVGQTKTIIFLYKKTLMNINVNVLWDDFNNRYNTRPNFIGVQLIQNGNPVPYEAVWVLSSVNNCSFTVPKADASGTPFIYTINYVILVDDYDTAVSGSAADGFTITNTLKMQSSIEVVVDWEDSDNAFGRRPANITVGLFRNGVPFQAQLVSVISTGNQQKVLFNNLDKYDAAGNVYVYTIVQQPIGSYRTAITGYTILNTLLI